MSFLGIVQARMVVTRLMISGMEAGRQKPPHLFAREDWEKVLWRYESVSKCRLREAYIHEFDVSRR